MGLLYGVRGLIEMLETDTLITLLNCQRLAFGFDKNYNFRYTIASMPLLQNAKKALRVSKRKAVINSRVKSRVKSAVQTLKATPSKDAVAHAYSRMDRAVKRNVIPKNRAARLKSQLSKLASQA